MIQTVTALKADSHAKVALAFYLCHIPSKTTMQTTDDWISQVTTWRFEQAWSSGTVATLRLPRTGTNTTLDPREGVIPGNEAEG